MDVRRTVVTAYISTYCNFEEQLLKLWEEQATMCRLSQNGGQKRG
jgi:hypothetical protein